MRGPFLITDKTGVTGESTRRTTEPNYVTVSDNGRTRTLTGKAAEAHREMALR